MFQFPPQDPAMMPADPMMGMDSMGAPMDLLGVPEGEYLEPEEEEDFSEPHPRPIDWRVRKYWDDEEKRTQLGRWLVEEIDRWYEAVSWRLDNLVVWRDDFEMMPAEVDTPYTGAATCRAPFTRYACAAHSRQLNQQIVSPEPVVLVEPMDAEGLAVQPDIEEAMNGRIEDSEWAREARALHNDLPVAGNGWFRVEYERRVKRAPRLKLDIEEEAYLNRFQALRLAGADPYNAQVGALPRDKSGALRYVLRWDEIVEFEGTGYKFIPFEDGVLSPPTCRDATKARFIGERLTISGLDLEQGAKEGRFIESEIEKLLKKHSDEIPEDRRDKLDPQGVEVSSAEGPLADHDPKYRDYLCYKLSLRLDGDDDGKEEIVVAILHHESNRVLDIRYSEYEHGEHRYHLAPFEGRPGELLGRGIAELVAVQQDAATANLNQLINHGDLQIHASSSLIVDDTAMLDPEVQVFHMGMFFRVRDVRGIREWPLTALPTEHYQMFQSLKDQVDLIAGVSNPSLGKATDSDRTAREVMVVESHASANFEGVAEGMSLFWSRVWDQTRSLEAQYARDGQVHYRKSRMARAAAAGPAEAFGAIDATALLAKVRVLPAGLRQLSDRQSRFSLAVAMNNQFGSNPVTAQNPEVWRIAIEYTMEAADYPAKEKVLLAVDRAAQMAEQQALQQQMMMDSMGMPPELLEAMRQLPPEALKAMLEQAQGAAPAGGGGAAPGAGAGMPPLPGAAGPEQGGPMPGVV